MGACDWLVHHARLIYPHFWLLSVNKVGIHKHDRSLRDTLDGPGLDNLSTGSLIISYTYLYFVLYQSDSQHLEILVIMHVTVTM